MSDTERTHPPRVLFIGAEWFTELPGGLNRYLGDLLTAVRNQRLPVAAVVVGRPHDQPAWVHAVSSLRHSLLRRLLAVRHAAARAAEHTDVVDVHFALYGLLPVLTTGLRRLPLVVHFQGPWTNESALSRNAHPFVLVGKRAVERAVYRRARAVVVLSAAFGRIVVDRYGVDPARVYVIAPGVDLDRFCPGDQASARRQLGLQPDAFVVAAARRLDARMGLDILLRAWAQVQRVDPSALLLIAGEGVEHERLVRQAADLPNPGRVRLLGRLTDDELVTLYRAADCSVVPTRALEGFGLVTLESLACGTPAIVTDVGGLPDGVRGLDASLVVPAEKPTALARRLIAAAGGELPGRAECRAHAERFAWADVARRHRDMYVGLARQHPASRRQIRRPQRVIAREADLYANAAQHRRLRVAYLDHTAALSGGELALARLLPALDGVDPHVILATDGPLADRLRTDGIRTEVLAMPAMARTVARDQVRAGRLPLTSTLGAAAYVVRLAYRLRRLRPDLVHTNSLKSAIYGGLAARLAGVPVIWHIRDRIAPDYLPTPAVRAIRALARHLPAGVVANSHSTLETLGPLRCPTAVVRSPIDPDLLHRPRPDGTGRPFTAVMVGRLTPWKGQHVFLEAFARAFPDGPQRALVVGGALFGEHDYERKLRALVASLRLTGRVDFTGHVDDIAAQLDLADVLVHASIIPEPFGLVVIEAMAAGLPVIAADAGGPAEVISHGIDGLLYPPGDAAALAALLTATAAHDDGGDVRAERARRRCTEMAPSAVAPQHEAHYRAVCSRRSSVGLADVATAPPPACVSPMAGQLPSDRRGT